MSRDDAVMGARRINSVTKEMEASILKQKLAVEEREYRQRFIRFVDVFNNAAETSECLTRTKVKTITKVMNDVVKGSDDLLLAFDKRRRTYQSAEALYENINGHCLQTADGLYTYCSHLQDISTVMLEARATGIDDPDNDSMSGALLPVHHVQVLANIFQGVKKDRVKSRRLVEVFSCNTLIEQLTKELERMRKVMKSINADTLLVTLNDMAIQWKQEAAKDPEPEVVESLVVLETPTSSRPDADKVDEVDIVEKVETVSVSETRSKAEAEQSDPQSLLELSNTEGKKNVLSPDYKIKIKRSPNVPQEFRYQLKTFASKITDMRNELSSLERKLTELKMSSGDTESESEDETSIVCFAAASEEENSAASRADGHGCAAFSREEKHKALLRSSMRRAPLYQAYRKFEGADDDSAKSSLASQSSADEDTINGKSLDAKDDDEEDTKRPESGIVLEEGFQDDPYEYIFVNGCQIPEIVESKGDYVQMCNAGKDKTSIDSGNKDEQSVEKLVEIPASSFQFRRYSLQTPSSKHGAAMNSCYVNIRMDPIYQGQPENHYSTIHDIFGADPNEIAPNAEKESVGDLPPFITLKRKPLRTGWCQIPIVKESGVLDGMTTREKNLQEAKYEIISSKVSYLKSLSVLQSVFISSEQLRTILSVEEWDDLFGLIRPIKQCSEHFLSDLLSGWPEDIFMTNQLTVVRQYAESGLDAYVDYCANKITMDETLRNIRKNKPHVNEVLKKLEGEEICDNHDLESFLVLPIQRITRFPLLVDGILHRLDSNSDKDFCDWAKTYVKLDKMAKRCNEAVRDAENRRMGSKYSRSATLPSKKYSSPIS